jgi:rhamnogalacturonyl hydrolase YesR
MEPTKMVNDIAACKILTIKKEVVGTSQLRNLKNETTENQTNEQKLKDGEK